MSVTRVKRREIVAAAVSGTPRKTYQAMRPRGRSEQFLDLEQY